MDGQITNYNTTETRCPGKEIVGMVFGINALVWGVFGAIFCWFLPIAITFGIIGIGCGITAMIMHSKVHQQATVITNKIETGKKLGIAGLITGSAAIIISITVTIIFFSSLPFYK